MAKGSATTDQSTLAPATGPPKKKLAVVSASMRSPSTTDGRLGARSTWNSGLRNSATRKLFPAMPYCVPFRWTVNE